MKLNCVPTRSVLLATSILFVPAMGRGAGGDTWIKKADMPTPRIGLSTCVLNGKIYAIGGYKAAGGAGMKTVEAYDPVMDSWTKRTDMPTARLWTTSAALNGKIYVIGGGTVVGSPLKTVEEYDPATDTWVRKTDMAAARWACAAGVVNGRIYVIGGLTTFGGTPLATVEAYDPVTDTWERKAAMPTRRGLLCSSVVDGKIFAIGSSSPPSGPWLPTVEMYDPLADTWTRKTRMPTARGALASSTAHGRIYVMGGRNCCTSFATVEEYDPTTDTWIKRADMWSTSPASPTRRWVLSASEVNNRIYAIGGAFDIAEPHPGVALNLEYTPPVTAPALKVMLVKNEGQSVIRLEWLSRADCLDLLQSRNQFQSDGWTDVERFSGTGQTLTKDIPAVAPAAFYHLQRELR